MIVWRLVRFLWAELWGSRLAQGVALGLILTSGSVLGVWYAYHTGYRDGFHVADLAGQRLVSDLRASWTAQVAASDAQAVLQQQRFQQASDLLQKQYLQEKARADAATQQVDQILAREPGAEAPLSPYLAAAARVLYGTASDTGTPH